MNLTNKTILVTGGAGFIGSHLVEELLELGNEVRVLDDLSHGDTHWLPDEAALTTGSVADRVVLQQCLSPDIDLVFHLAASKLVNTEAPEAQYRDNVLGTFRLLDEMQKNNVTNIAFTSSSTVYGEAPVPTPEEHAPLEPISVYGASKLSDESLLSVYAHSHDFTVWNFRFANIVGPRLRGAVIPDFIEKLLSDPDTLEILGDGRQEKSYMHIMDCIDAMFHLIGTTDDPVNTFNLGTRETTSVTEIADIVSDELGVNPEYQYTGGDRGWTGDVPRMCLSIDRLIERGWTPAYESDDAVRKATQELLAELS